MRLLAVPGAAIRRAQPLDDVAQAFGDTRRRKRRQGWHVQRRQVVRLGATIQFSQRAPLDALLRHASPAHQSDFPIVGIDLAERELDPAGEPPVVDLRDQRRTRRQQRAHHRGGRDVGQARRVEELQIAFQRVESQRGADRLQIRETGDDTHCSPTRRRFGSQPPHRLLAEQRMPRYGVNDRLALSGAAE